MTAWSIAKCLEVSVEELFSGLGQVHSDFVSVGDGEEANVIRTDEGQVLTFSFKKQ